MADERPLGVAEAVLWRASADPRLRATTVIVELLDHVPDEDRLVAAHEWGTAYLPRARERVQETGFGLPRWVTDEHADLSYHLRRAVAADPDGLLDLARTAATTPFDPTRPPWQATLVTGDGTGNGTGNGNGTDDGAGGERHAGDGGLGGLGGHGAAYVLALHEILTADDGGVELLGLLRSRTREHTPGKPTGSAASSSSGRSRPAGPLDVAARLAGDVLAAARNPRRAVT
ncbi:MAG TPA: wax ester/triacylglycerol synthase domain-containing protein, partial [Pseudonocardiaceae bacterium]